MGLGGSGCLEANAERADAGKKGDKRPLGYVSVGVASLALATTAAAQQVTLPPLVVEGKKAAPKSRPQAKSTPAPVEQAAPAPAIGAGDPDARPVSQPNTLQAGTGIGRLPGTVQDTPQTVNVVSQRTLQEQNVTTLDQALRNVPGITVAIGEGGGGMNGDQFRIRGFQAKGDIYVDGLRDFGVYVRDSFAYEQVQVIKGPSSESFGMGTTGGAINIQQKTAHRGDEASMDISVGTGPLVRTTIDVNKQINETTAARAVGMYHDQDLVDRDHLFSDRWGFLGSLAFGLGTDTKLTINYLHQKGERKPDMGVPIIDPDGAGGRLGRPITEFGTPRDNFYGKSTDLDDSRVDMLTARLSHKVNDVLTIQNDTRLAAYDRYFAQTVVNCTAAACMNGVASGNFNVPYGFGGPAGFDQETWGAQNITTAIAKFHTGFLRHEFVAGIDVFYQHDERTQLANSATKLPGTIADPLYKQPGLFVTKNQNALKEADATNFALFASDRVWLTPQFSLLGGVRWDKYSASYKATDTSTGLWVGCTPPGAPGNTGTTPTCAVDTDADTDFVSPKASMIWEPTKNQTYYATWARSYSGLAGQFISNDNASIGDASQKPEENDLWEIGAKYTLMGGKLGLTAALFRVEKTNARITDSTSGEVVPTGEKQRVQGVELGVTGNITDAWIVQAAYAYMDSEILHNARSGTAPNITPENANKGNRVAFVPEHAFTVWTTYEISKIMNLGRGKTIVGAGVTLTDEIFANSGNTSIIPGTLSFDALVSYEIDSWKLAVNGYNLTDELNYDASFGNRAVIAPGRTLVFTVGKKF